MQVDVPNQLQCSNPYNHQTLMTFALSYIGHVCVCIYIYIYIYISLCTHTHTHTHMCPQNKMALTQIVANIPNNLVNSIKEYCNKNINSTTEEFSCLKKTWNDSCQTKYYIIGGNF